MGSMSSLIVCVQCRVLVKLLLSCYASWCFRLLLSFPAANRLAASPCGRLVAGYGQDGTIHVWTAGVRLTHNLGGLFWPYQFLGPISSLCLAPPPLNRSATCCSAAAGCCNRGSPHHPGPRALLPLNDLVASECIVSTFKLPRHCPPHTDLSEVVTRVGLAETELDLVDSIGVS